jgi:hypothetical protein
MPHALGNNAVRFVDQNGVAQPIHFNAEGFQVCAQDYLQALAEGDIANHTPWEKMGYAGIAPASEIDVFPVNTAYTFSTGAAKCRCVGGANDNATGTGAKTVRIWYLKADYTEATTDVVLTGATPVDTTATDIFRVNAFRIVDFGSGGTNYKAAGNIDVYHATNATPIYSRILAGATRARNSIYTVPKGKTLYITSMTCGVTKGGSTGIAATFILRATYDAKLGALTAGLHFVPLAEINHIDGAFYKPFEMPIVLPQYTDLKVSVIAAQAATIATAALRGWLEPA